MVRNIRAKSMLLSLSLGLVSAVGVVGTARSAVATDEVHYSWIGASAVTFEWRGDASSISYGSDATYGTTVTAVPPVPVPWSSPGPYWEAKLTGLTPGSTYHYSIGGAADATFTTAPPGDFRFDAAGDYSDSVTNPWVAVTHQQMAADNPAMVLLLGDLSYENYNCPRAVDQFYNDMANTWGRTAAAAVTWGNHESANVGTGSQPCAVRDNLANYKGLFDIPNPQTVSADGPTTTTGPGCPLMNGINPCRGEDWGWFDAGHVRFITSPDSTYSNGSADWCRGADTVMAAAQSDPNIYFIVTAHHEPAYSSQAGANDTVYQTCINGFGDNYSKYLLNLAGHAHGGEIFSAAHNVTSITAGGGGEGQVTYGTPAAGSLFVTGHPNHVIVDVVGTVMTLRMICGPQYASSAKYPCALGSQIGPTVTLTSPVGPPPVPDTTPPTVPSTLAATAASSTQVNVSWTAASDNVGVTGYRVTRNGTVVAASVTGTSYSDTTVAPNMSYTYTAAALDAAGNVSPESASASASTPPLPTAVDYFASSDASVEASAGNFNGTYSSASRVTWVTESAYDRLHAMRIANGTITAQNVGLNYKLAAVSSVKAGVIYTGSVWVRSTMSNQKVNLYLREVTPTGTAVSYSTKSLVLPSTGWYKVSGTYTARTTGDVLKYSVYATALSPSAFIYADLFGLTSLQ